MPFVANRVLDFVSSAACLMISQLKVGLSPEWLVWRGPGNFDHPALHRVSSGGIGTFHFLCGEGPPLFLPAEWQA